ncbi:MAG: hypothetical protein KY468_07735 [Armatimonadetes bacterium]|nr:hypothetical protein [Armatimonadota bacterium]
MRLEDLPQFTITRVQSQGERTQIHGGFTHTSGVRKGLCFLYTSNRSFAGILTWFNRKTNQGVIADITWSEPAGLHTGDTFSWVDGYWDPGLVRNILEGKWEPVRFEAEDAVAFYEEGHYGWTKVDTPLSENCKPVRIIPKGWDHEHCEICRASIDEGDPGYRTKDEMWLCKECYEKYGAPRDLLFMRD